MSKKGILTLTIILILALALVVVGVTLAWYTSGATDSSSFVLNANGFLVVYFDDEVTTNDVKLKPAVMTKPGAVSDTPATGFKVLEEGNGIDEVATVSEFTAKFAYVNSSNTEETEGETTVVRTPSELSFQISAEAVDYDGTKTALKIGRDITVTVTVSGEYVSFDEDFEEVVLDFVNPVSVNGDIDLTINLSAYITEPDELCNPVLLTAEKVVIKLTVTATSDNGSESEETN